MMRKMFATLHVGCDVYKENNDVLLEVRLVTSASSL
jgi:hypothetical protein